MMRLWMVPVLMTCLTALVAAESAPVEPAVTAPVHDALVVTTGERTMGSAVAALTDQERRQLEHLHDPALAEQRAGEFYQEPLFWGGVLAGVILIIVL